HLFGRSRNYPFSVRVRTNSGVEEQALGALNQQPIVPSWVLPALEILVVVLFATFAASRFFGDDNNQVEASTPVMAMDAMEQSTLTSSDLSDTLNDSFDAEDSAAESTTTLPTELPAIVSGSDGDDDADGLTNGDEETRGTDPLNPDTDGDSLRDGDEVTTYQTDPLYADTDLDGVSDGDEIAAGT
ncbi:MAG: hypothetical protein GY943_03110, partial [Chloroflexi bacterium]|nr:hypothetical protein [Chloroflexota bacterium]